VSEAYRALSDYGIIGNLATCALISRTGSVDWLCTPHLESPSVFAAILDAEKGGSFRIAPTRCTGSRSQYVDDTNVLAITFATPGGTCNLTDCMPVVGESGSRVPLLVRKLVAEGCEVELAVRFAPAFDYARRPPCLSTAPYGLVAESGGQRLRLWASVPLAWELRAGEATGTFVLHAGEEVWFSLGEEEQDTHGLAALLERTLAYASPLGLHAEEIDTQSGEQLGNFPQAFSHVGLIESVLAVSRAVAHGSDAREA